MLHLSNNIKIIRSLSGKTQDEFRQLFTNVSLAMQKSYEGGKAEPDSLYMQELSEMAGISNRDLINKEITKKDVNIKVEKVENVSNEGYPEKSLNNLTESNKVLAEANKTLAEANKTLAEANHVISKNHDELIQLTKMIVNFSNTPKVIEEHLHSGKQEGAHPALGDLALDKKYSRDKKTVKDR